MLGERIEALDLETRIMNGMSSSVLDNVNSDILRRSTKSSELRRRREKERIQLDLKKKQVKEDLVS